VENRSRRKQKQSFGRVLAITSGRPERRGPNLSISDILPNKMKIQCMKPFYSEFLAIFSEV